MTTVRSRPAAAVMAGTVPVVICTLPVFLVATMSVVLAAELGLNDLRLGFAVSAYWAASSVSALLLGRIIGSVGGARATSLAAAAGFVVLALLAAAWSWQAVIGVLVLAGAVNAAAQLGGNIRIAEGAGEHRLGLALAVKQSAVPLSTLLAGLAMPTVTLQLGWRWAPAICAVGGLLAAVTIPILGGRPVRAASPVDRPRLGDRAPAVFLLAAGCGFACIGQTAVVTFAVPYLVSAGQPPGGAGLIFALAGAAAIVCRLLVGAVADRRPDTALGLAAGLVAGSCAAVIVVAVDPGMVGAAMGGRRHPGWWLAGADQLRRDPHLPNRDRQGKRHHARGRHLGLRDRPDAFRLAECPQWIRVGLVDVRR